jgi:hypothetical protein
MNALTLVATVVVLVGVAVFILLFERKRARSIESDLRETAEKQRDAGADPGRR